ncbi:acyl carrier protein 1 [Pyrus ussuriensis x Pyrus communis]|uniref:Acyl carrier protein n=1 Tax=Pyrus ussuriensis x Pyrus communis TaxID=2448454 RepID=A0A5N5HQE3_9ROSA|nr:acyl carrier protein 1, chloroplastic [Pyrus x bretschneideri]KAB2630086.1 acyl carrier protein 1 [Pyrus ussuriensis x Pyrus communis]
MAAVTGASSISLLRSAPQQFHQNLALSRTNGLKSVSLAGYGRSSLSFGLQQRSLRLRVSCAAKPETVAKVSKIVRKQLALPDDSAVTGESKFSELGADSLDTVEIVMGLEEEFGISVEEDSAQTIATVQDAADLIEKLIEKNKA